MVFEKEFPYFKNIALKTIFHSAQLPSQNCSERTYIFCPHEKSQDLGDVDVDRHATITCCRV